MTMPNPNANPSIERPAWWNTALTLGHLESRLHACRLLDSASEYRQALILYVKKIADEGFRGKAEEVLKGCIEKNPFVGEPHVLLSQVYLSKGRYEEGEKEAERGLILLLEWGSSWDKRHPWEGWVAWARVLLMKAKEKSWPNTSKGILNLSLV